MAKPNTRYGGWVDDSELKEIGNDGQLSYICGNYQFDGGGQSFSLGVRWIIGGPTGLGFPLSHRNPVYFRENPKLYPDILILLENEAKVANNQDWLDAILEARQKLGIHHP